MATSNYSINFSAVLYYLSAEVAVGQCVIPVSAQDTYVPATAANRGTRRSHGVALTAGVAGQVISYQADAVVPNSVTALGTGTKSWVRVSTTGYLERITTPAFSTDDVVGYCDTDGTFFASFGVGPATSTAALNVKNYGAVGDGTTDDTTFIQSALTAAGTSGGTVWFPPGTYKTTARLNVSHNTTVSMAPQASILAAHYGDVMYHAGTINGSTAGNVLFDRVTIVGSPTTQAYTVTNATNATPIVITTSAAHGLSSGDFLEISSVGGNTAANRVWMVAVVNSTSFSLYGSAGNGAYTSGGTIVRRPRVGLMDVAITYDTFRNCNVSLCTFGGAADQSEICSYYDCVFANNKYANFYIPNGPDLTPTASAGFANVITMENCDFAGGLYGLADDGGVNHYFRGCNWAGNTIASMRLASLNMAEFSGDIESESIHTDDNTLLSVSGSGGCSALIFVHLAATTGASPIATFYASTNAVFRSCEFTSSSASYVTGGNNAYRIIFEDILNNGSSSYYVDGMPTTGQFGVAGSDTAKTFLSAAKPDPSVAIFPGVCSAQSTWALGDTAISTNPATSGCVGWVCTTAGLGGAAAFSPFGETVRRLSRSVAGSANVNLTATEAAAGVIELTGVITGNIDVTIPAAQDGKTFAFNNATTGAFTLTVKVLGQTGFVIATARKAMAYSNATDLVRLTADVA